VSLLPVALRFRRAHIVVVAVASDHSKAPLCEWAGYYDEGWPQPWKDVVIMLLDAHALGVLTGAPSGGLEMIEVEASGMGAWTWIRKRLVAACPSWERVEDGYCTESPHGGLHFLLRAPEVLPSTPLVWRFGAKIIETRGERGMTVEAGVIGRGPCEKCETLLCVPCEISSGLGDGLYHERHLHTYRLRHGGPESIARLTQDEYEGIHAALRSQSDTRGAPVRRTSTGSGPTDIGPGWRGPWETVPPEDYLNYSVEFIRTEVVGNRNQRLYGRACACWRHVVNGDLDADDVWDSLLDAALEAGLDRRNAESTLRSALKRIERADATAG
jgi:hypothetical protein